MRERYLARNARAAWRVYEGEAVILSADDSTFHTLNRAGTALWIVTDGVTAWDALVDRVAGALGVAPAHVEPDLRVFAERLEALGLVTASSESLAAEPDPLYTLDALGPGGAYEPARVASEPVFETTALACGKKPGGAGKCTASRKLS